MNRMAQLRSGKHAMNCMAQWRSAQCPADMQENASHFVSERHSAEDYVAV